jgi:hypothetical protein
MRKLMASTTFGFLMITLAAGAAMADQTGRYKKDGTKCEWDAKDTGPNQCTPRVEGRFKKTGDSCAWVTGERGEDQCRPAKGRFKVDGTACVWSSTDTGQDQCDPHQVR